MKAQLVNKYRIKIIAETDEERDFVKLVKSYRYNLSPKGVLAYPSDELAFYLVDENDEIIIYDSSHTKVNEDE